MAELTRGAVLLAERAESGDELARLLSVEPSSVSRWRSGARLPATSMRERIAATLGVPVESWTEAATAASTLPATAATDVATDLSERPTLDEVIEHVRALKHELRALGVSTDARIRLRGELTRALALRHRLEVAEEIDEATIIAHPAFERVLDALVRAAAEAGPAVRDAFVRNVEAIVESDVADG